MRKNKTPTKPDNVTYTQSFAAVVHNPDGLAGPKLVVKSPRWYRHQLSKFKDGEQVSLVVHNRKPKRTDAQNRYYWGVYLPLIAGEGGEERNKDYIEVLHERFKGEFLNKGLFEAYGKKVWLKKSTTELGVAEFCQYILDIERLTGVEAPPTENYGLEPLRGGEVGEELSTE